HSALRPSGPEPVTAPEARGPGPKQSLPSTGARALLIGLAITAAAGAGCPPRDAGINITASGAQFLLNSCKPSSSQFTGPNACDRRGDPQGGTGGNGNGDCACTLSDSPMPTRGMPLQARLFVISPSDLSVQDSSKCMTLTRCIGGGTFGSP